MPFRMLICFLIAFGAVAQARAHFLFLVRDAENPSRLVAVFSEDLEPDENISAEYFAGLKLTGRFDDGKQIPLECEPARGRAVAELGLVNPQCAFGTLDLGVRQRGEAPGFRLTYFPKAVFAGAEPKYATLGPKVVPVELVPVVSDGKLRFRFLSGGEPVAGAEVVVIEPEGGKSKAKTDDDGYTEGYPAEGRYGAWAKVVDEKPGQLDGKQFEESRHYATLVVDATAP